MTKRERRKAIKQDIREIKEAIRFAGVTERMCIRMFMEEKDQEKCKDILNDIKHVSELKVKWKEEVKRLKKELRA